MNEDELVARLLRSWPRVAAPGLRVGPGDDCALLAGDRVVTADLSMEGVHFRLDWATPGEVGWKAVAANLSDLAAAGAEPAEAALGLALPRRGGEALAEALYAGMGPLATRYGVALAGGDTCAWDGPLVIAVTAFGRPGPHPPPGRAGARPGDTLWVSGTLGDAALGLTRLRAVGREGAWGAVPAAGAVRRHLLPDPRVELGRAAAASGRVHAMMDLSDGLSVDLPRICRASGVAAVVDLPALPLSPEVASRADAFHLAVHGGEDYELLLATDAPEAEVKAWGPAGPDWTRIGTVVEGEAEVWGRAGDGSLRRIERRGWDPFRG